MADKKATTANETTDISKPQVTGWRKFLLDFGPLLVFFLAFRAGDVFVATGAFMIAIVAAAIYSKIKLGHVSAMHKFTFVVVMVLGGLTLYLQDETFVKMKLTIVNSFFALAILIGLLRGQLYIKMIMEMAFELPDSAWRVLSRNYAIFFAAMAIVNELIWRTQTTEFWVNFKTFGYMAINFLFILGHMPMLMKHMPEETPDEPTEENTDRN
ncbi:MAG: septation protein IspZ [Alphaproteobacteria bacterium]|nr:septation protein IspZ [Alphaproteobacteria bacterium]